MYWRGLFKATLYGSRQLIRRECMRALTCQSDAAIGAILQAELKILSPLIGRRQIFYLMWPKCWQIKVNPSVRTQKCKPPQKLFPWIATFKSRTYNICDSCFNHVLLAHLVSSPTAEEMTMSDKQQLSSVTKRTVFITLCSNCTLCLRVLVQVNQLDRSSDIYPPFIHKCLTYSHNCTTVCLHNSL